MDTAFNENLDGYISRLQRISKKLKGGQPANPLKVKRDLEAIALKSARLFLGYCALVALLRRNVSAISEPSCLGIITVPANWLLGDIKEAAKLIFKEGKVGFCIHPVSKGRRGWDIDPAEHLEFRKLFVFVQAGSSIHEDFEIAATFRDRLGLCEPHHLRALSHFRGCGPVGGDQAAVIALQPSERMEAIFRVGQPAQRAAQKLFGKGDGSSAANQTKHFDISKGFGEASEWSLELIKDLHDWRDGSLPWSEVDKGCLMYGPPGTGKTRFVAALAALDGLHLEVASVSKWQSNRDGALGDKGIPVSRESRNGMRSPLANLPHATEKGFTASKPMNRPLAQNELHPETWLVNLFLNDH
jgi:cell division protease FtsH